MGPINTAGVSSHQSIEQEQHAPDSPRAPEERPSSFAHSPLSLQPGADARKNALVQLAKTNNAKQAAKGPRESFVPSDLSLFGASTLEELTEKVATQLTKGTGDELKRAIELLDTGFVTFNTPIGFDATVGSELHQFPIAQMRNMGINSTYTAAAAA
ncbi:MAG: hypothetical protein ACREX0_12135 [Noviherbaspirillum sp.]